MSLINSSSNLPRIAELILPVLDFDVATSVQPSARAAIALPFVDFEVNAGNFVAGACSLNLEIIAMEIAGRINNQPNVFGNANLDLPFVDFAATGRLTLDAVTLLELPVLDFEVDSTVRETEASELQFICTILPQRPNSFYSDFEEKLTVDGAEIKIREWSYDESADRTGATLNVTLLNPADIAVLNNYSSIKFEIGEKLGDDWHWETLIESGDVQQSSFVFGRNGNAPADGFSFSTSSDLNQKLGKTPATDLVIYDSSALTLDSADFEPILDTDGREYKTQLVPKFNLKLYDLFQKVFVERCGFSAVNSNLPNYPVTRVDFETGASYFDSFKGIIGMFAPLCFERGGALWITDATAALPAGFPVPRTVTISRARALSTEQNRKRLDAFKVIYSEDERNFDYITYRSKSYSEPSGTFGTSSRTDTDFEMRWRQYRKFSQPAVVISEKLEYKHKTVHNADGIVIDEMTETYAYDRFGDLVSRTRRIDKRIPDLNNDGVLTLLAVREEEERLDRASHPFEKRKRFLKRREVNVAGEIGIDSETQQLGKDFEREMPTAYRSGNLVESMTTRFGAISTKIETFEPLKNGTVKVHVFEKDHISDLVIRDEEDDVQGEITTNALAASQNRIYVFDEDNAARSTERIENFNVGELPLTHAIPLARRVLKKRKNKPNRLQMEIIGRDNTLTKGTPIRAVARGGAVLGNFLIEGRSMRGGRDGRFMTITGKEI